MRGILFAAAVVAVVAEPLVSGTGAAAEGGARNTPLPLMLSPDLETTTGSRSAPATSTAVEPPERATGATTPPSLRQLFDRMTSPDRRLAGTPPRVDLPDPRPLARGLRIPDLADPPLPVPRTVAVAPNPLAARERISPIVNTPAVPMTTPLTPPMVRPAPETVDPTPPTPTWARALTTAPTPPRELAAESQRRPEGARVMFRQGSAALTRADRRSLSEFLRQGNRLPALRTGGEAGVEVRVRVIDGDERSHRLATSRATAVKRALTQSGVPAAAVRAVALSDRPASRALAQVDIVMVSPSGAP
jgi:outer membrane protein OmpA-like peptidoglycan-associated protein